MTYSPGVSPTPNPSDENGLTKQGGGGRFNRGLSSEEFERYRLIAKQVAYSILKNEEEADEIVGEVFLYMCKTPIARDIPLEAQVCTIARSRAINRYRSPLWQRIVQGGYRLYRKNKQEDEYESLPLALIDMGPEEQLLDDEFAALISKATRQLKEPLRICFTLHYAHGMSRQEIAQELGLTYTVVCKRLDKAMKQVISFVKDQVSYET